MFRRHLVFFVTNIRRKGCRKDKDRPWQHLANDGCHKAPQVRIYLWEVSLDFLFPNWHCERKSYEQRLWKAARCSLFVLPSYCLLCGADTSVHLWCVHGFLSPLGVGFMYLHISSACYRAWPMTEPQWTELLPHLIPSEVFRRYGHQRKMG